MRSVSAEPKVPVCCSLSPVSPVPSQPLPSQNAVKRRSTSSAEGNTQHYFKTPGCPYFQSSDVCRVSPVFANSSSHAAKLGWPGSPRRITAALRPLVTNFSMETANSFLMERKGIGTNIKYSISEPLSLRHTKTRPNGMSLRLVCQGRTPNEQLEKRNIQTSIQSRPAV